MPKNKNKRLYTRKKTSKTGARNFEIVITKRRYSHYQKQVKEVNSCL